MSKRKTMPSNKAIFNYWIEVLHGNHALVEVYAKNDWYCFACDCMGVVQRCHILPNCEGGSEDVDNLHLLCRECHLESEYFSGKSYWAWFNSKNKSNSASIQRQVNIGNMYIINFNQGNIGKIPSKILSFLELHKNSDGKVNQIKNIYK